jgi:hypothetical protein
MSALNPNSQHNTLEAEHLILYRSASKKGAALIAQTNGRLSDTFLEGTLTKIRMFNLK